MEQGFRQLKDVSAMRPIYHRVEHRVKGDIFVAALALLIHLIQCRQGLTSELRLGKVVILLRSAPQPVVGDSVCIRAGLDSDWLGSSCHCLCAACRCGFAENKLELTCGDHNCNRVLLDLSFCELHHAVDRHRSRVKSDGTPFSTDARLKPEWALSHEV